MLVWDRLSGMRRSFLAQRERMKKANLCDCASCAQLDSLSLKFVAHEGEVAEQRVKRNVELAGVDDRLQQRRHRQLRMGQVHPVPIHVVRISADVGNDENGVPDGHELGF